MLQCLFGATALDRQMDMSFTYCPTLLTMVTISIENVLNAENFRPALLSATHSSSDCSQLLVYDDIPARSCSSCIRCGLLVHQLIATSSLVIYFHFVNINIATCSAYTSWLIASWSSNIDWLLHFSYILAFLWVCMSSDIFSWQLGLGKATKFDHIFHSWVL